ALATLTQIQGSAYRRPGAKLLIDATGGMLGGVSGGCLEEDVRHVGLEVIAGGRARALHYDTRDGQTKLLGLGLGCAGQVDISVQPISPEAARDSWLSLRATLAGDAPFALALIAGEGAPVGVIALGDSGRIAGGFGAEAIDAEVLHAASAAL